MKKWDTWKRWEEEFEIIDVKYDDVYKDTFIVMRMTSWTYKGTYNIVMESEIDNTYIIQWNA